jgi:hypothetical protein
MTPKDPEFSEEYLSGSSQTETTPYEVPVEPPTEGQTGELEDEISKPRRVVIRAQVIDDSGKD